MYKKRYFLLGALLVLTLVLLCGHGYSFLQVQLCVNRPDGTSPRINAASEATVSHLHGGGDEKNVHFRKGVLELGFPYGVTRVEGCFALEDIRKVWPDVPLSHDWPFSFSVFSTGTDGKKDVRLSVSCDTELNTAMATVYFFYDYLAEPVIVEWMGKIGEKIAFGFEV